MEQNQILMLAIAHAYARGKQKRELTRKVKLAKQRRAERFAEIVRRYRARTASE